MFTVYICEADTLEEKLAWFERINTAGEPLTRQEMRSAIACGAGTTLAKKYFVDTRVQEIYVMTDDEIAALPDGMK